jgi:predicted glycoside hydrolase/deacetylase ChbG (UPF0249 family)
MNRHIQICADDYGFDAAVSLGILDCVDAGRISATSCMTLSPAWPQWAPALRERAGSADFGLHLDINEFANYAVQRPLSGWISATYLRRVDAVEARSWVSRQLDGFEAAMQCAPDYLDGHQHVHQLPVLRSAVCAELTQRYGQACALRSTRSRVWRGNKAAIIAGLGASALRWAARSAGLRMNLDFAGVYDFAPTALFSARVDAWLRSLPDGGLLMTHPGRSGGTQPRPDAVRHARTQELEFWLSAEAGELLAREGVQLGRCQDWPAA